MLQSMLGRSERYPRFKAMKFIQNYGNLKLLLKGVIRYGSINSRDYT